MKERNLFNDVKVADFAWNAAAPLASKFMADYGATVVHVESHTHLDLLRVISPFKDNIPGVNKSGCFSRNESSKFGITLNLNKPKGYEVAMRLIKWADIVVESFTPGRMKQWKLDYDSVIKERPDIIYLSSTQQGQTGPYALYAGYGDLVSALAGFFYTTGKRGDTPAWAYAAYSDWVNPPLAIAVLFAAMDYRERTGKGTYIDQAQLEVALHYSAPWIMDYAVNNQIQERNGNRLPYAAPHGVFPCLGDDRWVAIAVFTDKEWDSLCQALGRPAWVQEARFRTFEGRKGNEDELEKNISEWTRQFTAEQVMSMMQLQDVPAGVVKTGRDLFEDPQLAHRKHFTWLENSAMGRHAYESAPFVLSKVQPNISPAPMLGEHNEYVYKEIFKFTDDEIADFLIEGVITTDADLPEYSVAL